MKLTSKEQCPVTVRDRLVEQWGKVDVGICDMKIALEMAEERCQELNNENFELKKICLKVEKKAIELHEALDRCTKTLAELLENDNQ